jgi:hypothetical protein
MEIQIRRIKIQGARNKSKIRRNEIKMPVPSANLGFSIGYLPFQRAFARSDILRKRSARFGGVRPGDDRSVSEE